MAAKSKEVVVFFKCGKGFQEPVAPKSKKSSVVSRFSEARGSQNQGKSSVFFFFLFCLVFFLLKTVFQSLQQRKAPKEKKANVAKVFIAL